VSRRRAQPRGKQIVLIVKLLHQLKKRIQKMVIIIEIGPVLFSETRELLAVCCHFKPSFYLHHCHIKVNPYSLCTVETSRRQNNDDEETGSFETTLNTKDEEKERKTCRGTVDVWTESKRTRHDARQNLFHQVSIF